MQEADSPLPEDHEALLLAACDEALAAGLPATLDDRALAAVGGDSTARLAADVACLKLLHRVWPRSRPASTAWPTEIGRFRLLGELGRGGHGIVFLALDPALGRRVALKVPRPEALLTADLRRRFLREGQAAAELDHPNLVPVYEVGEAGAICYIASAYCPGVSLAKWLKKRSVSPHDAATLVQTLAGAVHYMHTRGVLHRDLKPANVLLQFGPSAKELSRCTPRITDFGLARVAGDDATRTGAVLGTPAYMAPEQAAGHVRDISTATDVYALGAILYELLTGQPPFGNDSSAAVLVRVLSSEPARPRSLRPNVPWDLEAVCLKCLEKSPGQRYALAAELEADLGRYLRGEPTQARPVGSVRRLVKWCRRRPAAAAAWLTAAASVLIAAAGLTLHNARLAESNRRLEEQTRRVEERGAALRRQAYAAEISVAGNLAEAGRYGLMLERLNLLRPAAGEDDLRGFEWHYLWRLGGNRFDLRGHRSAVDVIVFSPDGRLGATCATDGEVRLWDMTTGALRTMRTSYTPTSWALAFTPDSRHLVVADDDAGDGGAEVWDLESGAIVARLASQWVKCCGTLLPNGRTVAIGGGDDSAAGRLAFWDWTTDEFRPVSWALRGFVQFLQASPDGRLLAAGVYVDTPGGRALGLQLIERSSGREVAYIPLHGILFHPFRFSPDSKTLAVVGPPNGPGLYDTETGQLRTTLRCEEIATAIAYSPDGREIAVAVERSDRRGGVRIWPVDGGPAPLRTYDVDYIISEIAFTPDGSRLAIGGVNFLTRLWTPNAPAVFSVLANHDKEIWGVACSRDGALLATCGDDHLIRVWNPMTGEANATLKGHESLVTSVAFTNEGQLVSAGYDGTVRRWDVSAKREIDILRGHIGPVRCVVTSGTGLIASAGDDQTIRLWDARTGELARVLQGHEDKVRCLAFSPDGRTLASGANDQTVRFWDITGNEPPRVLPDSQEVWCLAYSPDGQTLAVGTKGGSVRLLDAATGRELASPHGHDGGVRAVAFSSDGRTLATAGDDAKVWLWHTATGGGLHALAGHHAWVNAVVFDPRGRWLASADHNGTVLLWPAE